MKLISMIDFVLDEQRFKEDSDTAIFKITNYANFLRQPLNLGMFVPCDEKGNLLQEPKAEDYLNVNVPVDELSKQDGKGLNKLYSAQCYYQDAKERVLFENVYIREFGRVVIVNSRGIENTIANTKIKKCIPNWTIETLINWDLTLTTSAIKQI